MSEETEETQEEEEYNNNSSSPYIGILCSILNVVIDYTMEEPTPLEIKEWNNFINYIGRTKKREIIIVTLNASVEFLV